MRNEILTLANMLTALRIALVPLYLWLFSHRTWDMVILALFVFIVAAVTDLYDGRLARSRKEITRFGKFMDPLADKFLVIGALAQFAFMELVNFWLVAVIVVRDIWVTILRINAIKSGKELKTSGDAKLKTTIQLTVVITIIVLSGARIIAQHFGYTGPLIDFNAYKIFFNILLAVAVIFTVYSWFRYIFRGHPIKA
jgi:CDP-diacylglycerol--glycerol-3-phosphate 3-phosphatidyltransferase